jgi:hypothetical protein
MHDPGLKVVLDLEKGVYQERLIDAQEINLGSQVTYLLD